MAKSTRRLRSSAKPMSHWMMAGANSAKNSLSYSELLAREVFQFWVDETVCDLDIKRAASVIKKIILANN